MHLRDRLRELLLTTVSPRIGATAQVLYDAVRDAADVQFELHRRHYGSPERLASLDRVAFEQHSRAVDDAVNAFVVAVRREGSIMAASASDRAKVGRIVEVLPSDEPWLITLSWRQPLHRVPVGLSDGVQATLNALRRDVVDFEDPELAGAHQALLDALECLVGEFAGTFAPDSAGPPRYTEVPPEWKRTDRARYDQTLRDLSRARDAVLDRYKELMNAMSSRGHLPSPQDQPKGQSFNLTTGDNSPVTVNAPYAHATDGSTATAGAPGPQPATPVPSPGTPWFRSWAKWGVIAGAIGAIAGVAAIFIK
ncbi:hypothetical protein [Streptomyces sp. NPDC093225]|uniref:hypothetical protein n=1 Tax=Streptomyces sp. NPDC093225 TaxID=3366034 RepID=UPI0037F5367B